MKKPRRATPRKEHVTVDEKGLVVGIEPIEAEDDDGDKDRKRRQKKS